MFHKSSGFIAHIHLWKSLLKTFGWPKSANAKKADKLLEDGSIRSASLAVEERSNWTSLQVGERGDMIFFCSCGSFAHFWYNCSSSSNHSVVTQVYKFKAASFFCHTLLQLRLWLLDCRTTPSKVLKIPFIQVWGHSSLLMLPRSVAFSLFPGGQCASIRKCVIRKHWHWTAEC